MTDGHSRSAISADDTAQVDIAWSLDGSRIVASEQGTKAGIWVYPVPNVPFSYTYALELAEGSMPVGSPRYISGDRIAFEANGDIWAIPAGCSHCTFPASATQLTHLGGIGSFAWTSAAAFRRTVAVPPPPVQPPAPAALVLSGLRVVPAKFRALRRGSSISSPSGAKVTYGLSEGASVTFTVRRAVAGRRVGGRCVAAKRPNRRARTCTRYVAVKGSFTHVGRAGANSFRFSARIGAHALAHGRYILVAGAAAGTRRSGRGDRARRGQRRDSPCSGTESAATECFG